MKNVANIESEVSKVPLKMKNEKGNPFIMIKLLNSREEVPLPQETIGSYRLWNEHGLCKTRTASRGCFFRIC